MTGTVFLFFVKTLPFMRDEIGFDFVSELRKIQHIADLRLTNLISFFLWSIVDLPGVVDLQH